jgi:serine/threonine-protein kinase
MTDWLGKTLGKVRIEKLIARGGMAEVYYGLHTTLDRPAAVKVLLSFLEDDPDLKMRFEREARVLANLRHPNIVQIYDFDLAEGQPYFVMEYLDGPTLASYLNTIHTTGRRLSLPQIGRILVMVSSALDYAHAKGVIHRDIKPGNMLLTSKTTTILPGVDLPEDVEVILTDFGLLRLTDSASHSVSGTVSGTPAYMSPEQARGDKVDHRSDLYSLGVTLYELLTGQVPFEADTGMGILMKHISDTPPPGAGLPAGLQMVLDRALAKKPADRFASARELTRAFLEAANLNEAEVAPGYAVTPRPGSLNGIPAPVSINERETLAGVPTPPSTSQPAAARPRPPLAWLIAIPALLVVLSAAFYLLQPGKPLSATSLPTVTTNLLPAGNSTPEPPPATATSAAGTAMSMPGGSMTGTPVSHGLLRFYDVSGVLDEAILTTDGLPPAPAGFQYEAWLTGGETRRSLGIIPPEVNGKAELNFLDDQGRNLLVQYERMEITLEENPDSSPNPSGNVVYSSGIPPQALTHIRHLLVAFGDTPKHTGLLIGLMNDVALLKTSSTTLVTAYEQKNAAEVRKNTEAIYNLLVGTQGNGYGDLDKNGSLTDPGDGYGLFINGDHVGYIEGTIQHAQLAAQMPDASTSVRLHGGHVVVCGQNIEDWATQILQLIPSILADPLSAASGKSIREIAALADRIENGRDLNGNERVEPVPGEGGAQTALQHAGYMTDMPILEGTNQLPPPAPAAGPGTAVPTTSSSYHD